ATQSHEATARHPRATPGGLPNLTWERVMHFRSVAALGALLLSVACEVPVDTSGSNPDFGVTSAAIQPKTASVLVGDSLQLSASVVMSHNHSPYAVYWESTIVA